MSPRSDGYDPVLEAETATMNMVVAGLVRQWRRGDYAGVADTVENLDREQVGMYLLLAVRAIVILTDPRRSTYE